MGSLKSSSLSVLGLGYDDGLEDVPRITCKGDGLVADKVLRIARRYRIPVIEHPDLVEALRDIAEDETVPPAVFEAVAAIVAEVTLNAPKKRSTRTS